MAATFTNSQIRNYFAALAAPALTALLIAATWPFFAETSITVYLPAIVLTAWVGGFSLGLLSIAFLLSPPTISLLSPITILRCPPGQFCEDDISEFGGGIRRIGLFSMLTNEPPPEVKVQSVR